MTGHPPGRSALRPGRLTRAVGVGVLLAVLGGCATKRDVREFRAELSDRASREDSIMAQIVHLLGQLEDSVSGNAQGILETRADLMREMLDVQEQLIQVQELAGQNQAALRDLRRGIDEDRDRLSRPGPAVGPSDGDADAAFQAAMDAYARESLSAASRGFESFSRAYPQDPRAPDAEFYVAEILARDGTDENVNAAITRYVRIPAQWPDHPRAPQALYAAGLLELERGNPTEAAVFFDRVTGYEGTEWADQARQRLAEIR